MARLYLADNKKPALATARVFFVPVVPAVGRQYAAALHTGVLVTPPFVASALKG